MSEPAFTFDEASYAFFLRRALETGYTVGPVCEGLGAPSPNLILRHDVDYSLDRAVALAEIEHAAGVRSTYFIMVASAYYNALSKRSRTLLRRMADLGHEIGLHWDSSTYPEDEAGAAAAFRREAELLGDAAGVKIRSASQHIPVDNPAFDLEAHIEFEAYSKRFMNRYRYVSDSCMLWRGESVLELLDSGRDLYFLAHPLWWTARGRLQNAKLQSTVAELQLRLSDEMADYMDYLQVLIAGREDLDREFRKRRGWTTEGSGGA
jgi:peptidoglycan/xylan/chitin deacetylase (PgdA/CDA1 family)